MLSKLERGHEKDLADARAFVEHGLIEPRQLFDFFEVIEPELYRYPAVDPTAFRQAVEELVRDRRLPP